MNEVEKKRRDERIKAMKHSKLSMNIAKALKDADMLKIPNSKRGWGLSKWLVIMAAENIDKAIPDLLAHTAVAAMNALTKEGE